MLVKEDNAGQKENLIEQAQRCALLVIDELGDPTGTPNEDVILPAYRNTARLCRVARQSGIPVIYANDAHIAGLDKELELWGSHGIAGTPDAQTSPLLDPQPTDFVVEKRRYSAFFQTGLRLLLDELGVDTLLCAGFDTNICVRHTIADAYFNNYRIVVATDATASFLVGDQQEGLEYLKVCYAAELVSTDEAIGALR